MTTDIKQLRGTERLIRLDCLFDGKPGCVCSHCEASDTIARLAAERDRLKELYDAGCKQWNPVFKVVLDERDRLAGEVVTLKASLNEWVRENAPGGWIDTFRNQARERDRLKAALEEIKTKAPKNSPEMYEDYGGNFDDAWSGGWDSGFNAAANIARKALGGDAS